MYIRCTRKGDDMEKEEYTEKIMKIVQRIDDVDVLIKIYTAAKTHLHILQEKGGVIT